jgi:hypothetical protein
MTVMTITTVSREDSRRMKRRKEKRREREATILLLDSYIIPSHILSRRPKMSLQGPLRDTET